MGCLCPKTAAPNSLPNPPPTIQAMHPPPQHIHPAQPTSDRRLIIMQQRRERDQQFEKRTQRKQVVNDRSSLAQKSSDSVPSNIPSSLSNFSKNFSKLTTVVTKSARLERTVSYLAEPQALDSFLSAEGDKDRQELLVLGDEGLLQGGAAARRLDSGFYSLIPRRAYIKKHPQHSLHLQSPSGLHSLHCQPTLIRQTLFLTQGLPPDNTLLLTPTTYISQPVFDVQITLALRCLRCGKHSKHEYAVALIEMNFVCECGCGDFQVGMLRSGRGVPLWVEGRRVGDKEQVRYTKGGVIRGMGCTDCWVFNGCRVMACGCWKCAGCWGRTGQQCVLCAT